MNNYIWHWSVFFDEVITGGQQYYQWILSGLGWTIATSLSAWILAFIFGSLVGIIRTTPIKWLVFLGDAYVEIFRNIPLIVQMFLWYFVVPDLLPQTANMWVKQQMPLPEFTTAVWALAFFTAPRIAEQVKAGINSLAGGQKNAALALGLTLPQAYRHVLLPMAYRIVWPPLTSEFMNIFKNSSVALTIGLLELTAQVQQMNEYTFKSFEVYTVATIIYIIVAFTANRLMAFIEKRIQVPGYMGGN